MLGNIVFKRGVVFFLSLKFCTGEFIIISYSYGYGILKWKSKIQIGLWSFAEKIFSINKRWFNVEVPITLSSLGEEFYIETTEQVLQNGVFGYNNIENRANKVANNESNEKEHTNRLLFMIKRFWNTVFLKYEYMILMPEYWFLKKRPVLLPAAWIYRGFRTLKSYGIKRTLHKLKSPFVNRKLIKKREQYFEKWK